MSDDPRDLLTEAAPRPARAVDYERLATTARRRRVRTRALAATASVVVVAALVVGATSMSSGDSSSVAVRAGTPSTTSGTPAGWTRVTVDGAGVSIAIPPEWHRMTPAAGTGDLLVVGSAQRTTGGPAMICQAANPPDLVGTWVSLHENPTDPLAALPRPPDFRADTTANSCPAGSPNPNEFLTTPFKDAGRVFMARVGTVGVADPTTEIRLGEEVLNTLRVEPLASSTTSTTALPTTTLPGVPTSVAPKFEGTNGGGFFNAMTPDQQQIQQAFLGWLNGKNLDQAAPWIEDFASMRDAEAQGFGQHTPQEIAGYGGRVESVVVADPTHADVVYTLLSDGQPMDANRPGRAVKVGGKWLVTRDTACALLGLGGITCPPRTTPAP